jgi:hypothetical protein
MLIELNTMDRESFLSNIMEPIPLKIFPDGRKLHLQQPSVHHDNCRVRRSKATDPSVVKNDIA